MIRPGERETDTSTHKMQGNVERRHAPRLCDELPRQAAPPPLSRTARAGCPVPRSPLYGGVQAAPTAHGLLVTLPEALTTRLTPGAAVVLSPVPLLPLRAQVTNASGVFGRSWPCWPNVMTVPPFSCTDTPARAPVARSKISVADAYALLADAAPAG